MKPATYHTAMRYISLIALLCFCVPGFGQSVKVQGQVVDMSGAPVRNARVLLIDLTTLEIQRTSSDINGAFEFSDLRQTSYEIKAASPGFVTGSETVFELADKIGFTDPNPPASVTLNIKIKLEVRST